jgi:hypothetical protein
MFSGDLPVTYADHWLIAAWRLDCSREDWSAERTWLGSLITKVALIDIAFLLLIWPDRP